MPLSRLVPFLALCALFVLPFAAPLGLSAIKHAPAAERLMAAAPTGLFAQVILVPECGTKSAPVKNTATGEETVTYTPCSTCDFAQLIQNVVNFVVKYVALAGVALMLMIGGFYLIVGAFSSSPGGHQKGIRTIQNALIGLAIVLFSWLAIDTIIKFIARNQRESIVSTTPATLPKGTENMATDDLGGTTVTTTKYGPWNQLKCTKLNPVPVKTGPPPPAPKPTDTPSPPKPAPLPLSNTELPLGSVTSLDDLLKNQENAGHLQTLGVVFTGSDSCGGVSTRTNFQELRTGKALTRCANTCTTTSGCGPGDKTADPRMLEDLLYLHLEGYRYDVTGIATGKHAPNSAHYEGKAVDLVPKRGSNTTFSDLRNVMRSRNPTSPRVACEDNSGTIISNCGSGTTHVHVTYP